MAAVATFTAKQALFRSVDSSGERDKKVGCLARIFPQNGETHGGFPKMEVPQNGWFIGKNPVKMDEGTPILGNPHIHF